MEDVQNRPDGRCIPLDRVGVADLRYPIIVLDRDNQKQHTIAVLSMSVNLPHDFKGTHMSRFIEILNLHRGEITMRTIPALLHDLRKTLNAQSAHVEAKFPYFIEKKAPVTGAAALMDYECCFNAVADGRNDDFIFGVKVPVTSLCPCSKAISDYGAHNQRGYITILVRTVRDGRGSYGMVWFEELIEIAERSASAPVFPLLKRADERHVTMQAFDNPVFVEDIVRNVTTTLQSDQRIDWFSVHALNHESIHNHGAFASVQRGRKVQPEKHEGACVAAHA